MIADILHKIAEQEQGKDEDKKYYPRPSINDKCIRALVYWKTGAPHSPLPGRALHVFNDSSWHEELTLDWLRKSAYSVHSEQMEVECGQMSNGFVLYGHIDGILTDLTGKDFLFEHKAINHFTFERIWKGELPKGYICQCCFYIVGLQKVNPSINQILLLIKNKNTSQYLEILLEYDVSTDTAKPLQMLRSGEKEPVYFKEKDIITNITKKAMEKFEKVEKICSVSPVILPPRQYPVDSWQCDYCLWRLKCYEHYVEEFEELEIDRELDQELSDLAHYYLETHMHWSEMGKEKEKLKEQIKQKLKEKGMREGKNQDYVISLKLRERNNINQELIPADMLERAMEKKYYEQVNIRKIRKRR